MRQAPTDRAKRVCAKSWTSVEIQFAWPLQGLHVGQTPEPDQAGRRLTQAVDPAISPPFTGNAPCQYGVLPHGRSALPRLAIPEPVLPGRQNMLLSPVEILPEAGNLLPDTG